MARHAGRPKAGQEKLTRERIFGAALALIDEHGMETLSIRRLASALAVDPMAIYHYVPDKRALLAGVVACVFGELRIPMAAGDSWQEQVRAFAGAYRSLALAHPNLVLRLVADAEAAAGAVLAANEMLYGALLAAGLSPRMVIRAADLVVDYLHGFVLAECSGSLEQSGQRQELLASLRQHPVETFPAMNQVFGGIDEPALQADFAGGLEIILAGIQAVA